VSKTLSKYYRLVELRLLKRWNPAEKGQERYGSILEKHTVLPQKGKHATNLRDTQRDREGESEEICASDAICDFLIHYLLFLKNFLLTLRLLKHGDAG